MVIVGTWGLPKGWRIVKYVYEDTSTSVKSKSTLSLLDEVFKNEKKVIILQVTLADEIGDLKDIVIERVRRSLSDDPKTLEVFERAEKVIIPGRGKFMSNEKLFEFEASTGTILSALILKLYKLLDNDVILDVTHGVNFYTVMTRGVIEKLLRIISLGGTGSLKVGASDPFHIPKSKTGEDNITLTFRILESIKYSTKLSELPGLVGSVGQIIRNKGRDDIARLQAKWKKLKGKLSDYFIGLRAGSPLYWSYLLVNLYNNSEVKAEVDEIENKIIELIDNGYEIKDGKVIHKVDVDPSGVWALVIYKVLYDFAKNFVLKTENFLLNDVFLVNFDRLNELENHLSPVERNLWIEEKTKIGKAFNADLDEVVSKAINAIGEVNSNLNEFKESAPEKLQRRLKKLEDHALLEQLENLLKIITKDSVIPYGIVKAYMEGKSIEESVLWWAVTSALLENYKSEMVRNFLAHGGAEQNVTVLRRAGDLKMIGYYTPALIKLRDALKEELKKGQ